MLNIFKDRREYAALKRHLESSFEEQFWAKDSLARAFSRKLKGENSSLMVIGPKGKWHQVSIKLSSYRTKLFLSIPLKDCGKKSMIIEIGKFLHVPVVIISDAHDMKTHVFNPEYYISMKLLKRSRNDIEKASSGIVVLCNVNHFQLELQKSIAWFMKGEMKTLFGLFYLILKDF